MSGGEVNDSGLLAEFLRDVRRRGGQVQTNPARGPSRSQVVQWLASRRPRPDEEDVMLMADELGLAGADLWEFLEEVASWV